jgi:hypothetical protein
MTPVIISKSEVVNPVHVKVVEQAAQPVLAIWVAGSKNAIFVHSPVEGVTVMEIMEDYVFALSKNQRIYRLEAEAKKILRDRVREEKEKQKQQEEADAAPLKGPVRRKKSK